VDKYPGGWWIFFNNDSTTPDTKKGEIEKGDFCISIYKKLDEWNYIVTY